MDLPPQPAPDARRPRLRKTLVRLSAAAALTAVVAGAAVALFVWQAWSTTELPEDKPLAESTILTDTQGARLATLSGDESRVLVKLDDMPPLLTQAVVAAEDKSFYEHSGINVAGIVRAAWANFRNGSVVQGGSTITQQYVKTVHLDGSRTFERKFNEAILSMKLEKELSKEQILERYLNTIYLGRGAYGVQMASRQYFGKDVQQLTLAETSYLAGLIPGPEAADVSRNAAAAHARRAVVLERMAADRIISREEVTEINARPINSYVVAREQREPSIVAPDKGTEFFVMYVRDLLVQRYGEDRVAKGGLRVKTSLDLGLQAAAYDSVYGYLKPNEPVASLVSIDNNGAVKAMVGGRNWSQSKVNLAIGTGGGGNGRQAGSTFKAFALAAALENGVCYRTQFPGPANMVMRGANNGADWPVNNYDKKGFGNIDLFSATANSVNTVYAQLAMQTGPDRIAALAKNAGITSPLNPYNSLVLGTDSVSPMDMANSYLTFATGGYRVTPAPILEVRDSTGVLLHVHQPEKVRVMSERTAHTVTAALQQVVERGSGRAAQIGKPVAGKTGTTEQYGDAWFVGYTPTLATAVWMGHADGSSVRMVNVRGTRVTGGTFPARMFSSYMRTATAKDMPVAFKPAPDCTPSRTPPPEVLTVASGKAPERPARLSPVPAPAPERGRDRNADRSDRKKKEEVALAPE